MTGPNWSNMALPHESALSNDLTASLFQQNLNRGKSSKFYASPRMLQSSEIPAKLRHPDETKGYENLLNSAMSQGKTIFLFFTIKKMQS